MRSTYTLNDALYDKIVKRAKHIRHFYSIGVFERKVFGIPGYGNNDYRLWVFTARHSRYIMAWHWNHGVFPHHVIERL